MRDLLVAAALVVPLVALFVFERSDLYRRWCCRRFGHDWREHDRGAPVAPIFAVCARCGKFERYVLEEALRAPMLRGRKSDQGER